MYDHVKFHLFTPNITCVINKRVRVFIQKSTSASRLVIPALLTSDALLSFYRSLPRDRAFVQSRNSEIREQRLDAGARWPRVTGDGSVDTSTQYLDILTI